MTTIIAILCALVALWAQPGPASFTALLPTTAVVVAQDGFMGLEWLCWPDDEERCYAGIADGEISVGP